MRILLCGIVFAALLSLVPVARTDSKPGPNELAVSADLIDRRQQLVQRLLDTSKTLEQIKTNHVGDESDARIRLALLAHRLQQCSSPRARTYRDEVLRLRHDFTFGEIAVKNYLDSVRTDLEDYPSFIRAFRHLSKTLAPEQSKAYERRAQALETAVRRLAIIEPKIARELHTREELSRIFVDLAKLLDDSRHR